MAYAPCSPGSGIFPPVHFPVSGTSCHIKKAERLIRGKKRHEEDTDPPINPYAAGGQFGNYKMVQKTSKMTKTLTNGYSSESTRRELSNEYQHDRVLMIFEDFVLLKNVGSDLTRVKPRRQQKRARILKISICSFPASPTQPQIPA